MLEIPVGFPELSLSCDTNSPADLICDATLSPLETWGARETDTNLKLWMSFWLSLNLFAYLVSLVAKSKGSVASPPSSCHNALLGVCLTILFERHAVLRLTYWLGLYGRRKPT